MALFFYCKVHGRFPVTAVKTLAPDDLISGAEGITEAECPHCKAVCKPCGGCGKSIAPLKLPEPVISDEVTPIMLERWRNTKAMHCPDCELGKVCKSCGKDYSRGI